MDDTAEEIFRAIKQLNQDGSSLVGLMLRAFWIRSHDEIHMESRPEHGLAFGLLAALTRYPRFNVVSKIKEYEPTFRIVPEEVTVSEDQLQVVEAALLEAASLDPEFLVHFREIQSNTGLTTYQIVRDQFAWYYICRNVSAIS